MNASNYAVTGDANGTTDSTIWAKLTAGGSTLKKQNKTIAGKSVSVVTAVVEGVPYGAASPRSTSARPVFSNVNFKNCIINRGTNALFINCTFDGVTFIDGAKTMEDSSTATYTLGNNVRFMDCTFTGPIAQGDKSQSTAPAPTKTTLLTNNWEFNGATTIDFTMPAKDGVADSAALALIKDQATIMAPQTNIEMGSFTAPGAAKCSFQGVVVAGLFDVRGVAKIDGSIITLYDRSAADTQTLGYFGANDSSSNQGQPDSALQQAGGAAYGSIHIRYNPYRTLPDGINLCVSLLPDATTWREVAP